MTSLPVLRPYRQKGNAVVAQRTALPAGLFGRSTCVRATLVVSVLCSLFGLAAPASGQETKLEARSVEAGGVAIHRAGQAWPLLVQNAPPDVRPWIHPIVAPDGKGILTEESPSHHKHQTGLFFGFTRVNGRDYFHKRGGDYYRRKAFEPAKITGPKASWSTAYELLGEEGAVALVETQKWTLTDHGGHLVLDLDWSGKAAVDLAMAKFDYGGLFLRMPWRKEMGGEAVNSEGLKGGEVEGKRSRWVEMGMPVEGRSDWGRIAILDHPSNSDHPAFWRVDGSLGVGPARSRAGDWSIKHGETVRFRYRILVYTGPAAGEKVESEWKTFSESR